MIWRYAALNLTADQLTDTVMTLSPVSPWARKTGLNKVITGLLDLQSNYLATKDLTYAAQPSWRHLMMDIMI